jgi:hypothetical protein
MSFSGSYLFRTKVRFSSCVSAIGYAFLLWKVDFDAPSVQYSSVKSVKSLFSQENPMGNMVLVALQFSSSDLEKEIVRGP